MNVGSLFQTKELQLHIAHAPCTLQVAVAEICIGISHTIQKVRNYLSE